MPAQAGIQYIFGIDGPIRLRLELVLSLAEAIGSARG